MKTSQRIAKQALASRGKKRLARKVRANAAEDLEAWAKEHEGDTVNVTMYHPKDGHTVLTLTGKLKERGGRIAVYGTPPKGNGLVLWYRTVVEFRNVEPEKEWVIGLKSGVQVPIILE